MNKFKIVVTMLVLAAILTIGQPNIAKAGSVNAGEMPPAIVLVQDKNNKMLAKHNFEQDNGISIPWDMTNVDSGFYVSVPEGK